MSDLNDLIATNAVRAYNQGFERGVASEQERVLEVIQEWRKEITRGNRTKVVEYLIELIKGEQK